VPFPRGQECIIEIGRGQATTLITPHPHHVIALFPGESDEKAGRGPGNEANHVTHAWLVPVEVQHSSLLASHKLPPRGLAQPWAYPGNNRITHFTNAQHNHGRRLVTGVVIHVHTKRQFLVSNHGVTFIFTERRGT